MERSALISLARATGCAVARGGFYFLCDPKWGAVEQAQFAEITATLATQPEPQAPQGWLCVPSGGTSGRLKFARHDEQTLGAAARGLAQYFGLDRVNALDVLPAHHVSGLMARVRSAVTGGEHVSASWKAIEVGEFPELAPKADGWVLSLVPTQLQRLLAAGRAEWLRSFRVIFVGGGPVWPELVDAAISARLPVSLGYGMTETAAMVAALRPEEFLAGLKDCGHVLPHARLQIVDDVSYGAVPRGESGLVRIEARSLYRGYFGADERAGCYVTEDIGRLDNLGRLSILGRRDAVIITGGKKVFPVEVEAHLRASSLFSDVAVLGCADREWGQRVIACYPASDGEFSPERLAGAVETLAAHKRPKEFFPIKTWPRNEQGKINRAALAAQLTRA